MFSDYEDVGNERVLRSAAVLDDGQNEFGIIRMLRSDPDSKRFDNGHIRILRSDPYFSRFNRQNNGVLRILWINVYRE